MLLVFRVCGRKESRVSGRLVCTGPPCDKNGTQLKHAPPPPTGMSLHPGQLAGQLLLPADFGYTVYWNPLIIITDTFGNNVLAFTDVLRGCFVRKLFI